MRNSFILASNLPPSRRMTAEREHNAMKTMDKTLTSIILEGLEEAGPEGRGFGAEHLAAVRLANAAPDLLEAAKRLLAGEVKLTGESAGDVENWNAYRQIEAAVAKAEGKVEP